MDVIVNVIPSWGIGCENHLLVTIPADMKRFRALTQGKTLVYGRKTLETFPNCQPLKNRRNLILSTNKDMVVEGAEIFHSFEELAEELKKIPGEEISIIGGETIYRMFLPYCDIAYVTKIEFDLPADRFFPNLDEMPNWEVTASLEPMTSNGITFQFVDYKNTAPLDL